MTIVCWLLYSFLILFSVRLVFFFIFFLNDGMVMHTCRLFGHRCGLVMQDNSWWYYLLQTWRTIEYLYQSLNKFIDIITEKQSKNWQGNLTEDFDNIKSEMFPTSSGVELLSFTGLMGDMGFPISKTLDFKITWCFLVLMIRQWKFKFFKVEYLECGSPITFLVMSKLHTDGISLSCSVFQRTDSSKRTLYFEEPRDH